MIARGSRDFQFAVCIIHQYCAVPGICYDAAAQQKHCSTSRIRQYRRRQQYSTYDAIVLQQQCELRIKLSIFARSLIGETEKLFRFKWIVIVNSVVGEDCQKVFVQGGAHGGSHE